MIWLWRLIGLRKLLALFVLRKAWRMVRSRTAADAATKP
jgi:hypothetical protein